MFWILFAAAIVDNVLATNRSINFVKCPCRSVSTTVNYFHETYCGPKIVTFVIFFINAFASAFFILEGA